MKILVLPDVQAKPDVDLSYLDWVGRYLVDKQPDVVVCIGDFADMPSLSSYDVGKKAFEGRRYRDDIDIAHAAMSTLLAPLVEYNDKAAKNHDKRYNPRMVLTLGNHEQRIVKATNNDPKLEGTIGLEDLAYEEFGWEVYPFLSPVVIENVSFCHYFPSGVLGRPVTSARQLLTKMHMSCVAGHQQGRDIAYAKRADGRELTSIIAGSCYLHDEDYLNPFTNNHWRGLYMLHEVVDGSFDEMAVSLGYLASKYAGE